MDRDSGNNKVLIITETGQPEQDLIKAAENSAQCSVLAFQKAVSDAQPDKAEIIIAVFEDADDINIEKLKLVKSKFTDSDIIVIQNSSRSNRKSELFQKACIENGADLFLVNPSQIHLLEPHIRKIFSKKNNYNSSYDELELRNALSLANSEIYAELEIKRLLRKSIERTLTLTGADIGTISIINNNAVVRTETLYKGTWTSSDSKKESSFSGIDDIVNHIKSAGKDTPVCFNSKEVKSHLNTPLLDRNGEILGFFEIAKSDGDFNEQMDYEIISELGKSTALVLENLNLLNYTKSKLDTSKFYEKSFRHLIENSPYSIILIQHNKIKFVNNRTIQNLGYTRTELLNRNIIDIISPQDVDDFMAGIKKVQSSGNTLKITARLKAKDDGIVKYELEIGSMIYEGKQSVQLVAREIGQELGISKETVRLAAAVNSLHTAVTITDMDRKILYVNPAHKKSFGYEPGELLGKESSILFPFDDPSGVSEKIYDAIQMLGWEGERIGVRKNGQVFPVYEKISVVKDQNGSSVGIVSILEDITNRKRLEQALRESEERYRTLVDTANTAIIAVDEKGKITFINPAAEKLFDYSRDELLNKNITVLMPEKYKKLFKQKINNSTESEFSNYLENTVEFTGLKKNGEEVPLEISISKCRIEGTKIYTAIIMDITERKNLQEQLIQSAKLAAIGELISGVTHEVNNPLAVVLGYAEMIMAEPDIDDETRKYIGIIYKESERARKVIQNLLSFARQHNPEKEKVSINELLDNTLTLAEYDIRKSNISIKKNYAQNLPYIMADPNQLQQVFLNLLINAQQAVSERKNEGEISLETSLINDSQGENKQFVLVTISDNGKGIQKNILAKIFDPFFTTKPVNKGTGLGLSVSHGIIKEHNGNIYAENNEGEGARFYIELPV